MDGAASEFDAVFQGLALRFEAGKGGEQRGMNIQYAIWKFGDKKRRKQAHVSSEADEVHFVFIENGSDLTVVDFAFQAFRRNYANRDATRASALDTGSALTIADD